MASPIVTVTVLLFTLTLSVASIKLENDITADNLSTLSAEPDPDTSNPTLPGSGSDLPSSDEITIPVNFVNFHPINRHFPRRQLTRTPFNRRPCHHRRHELWGRGLQIPYGNDMIISGEEKATSADRWPRGVDADIPAIKMLVGPFGEHQEDGSREVMVKLIKPKGDDERGYYKGMFKRKIRKFLNI